jgi:hypothetical protein
MSYHFWAIFLMLAPLLLHGMHVAGVISTVALAWRACHWCHWHHYSCVACMLPVSLVLSLLHGVHITGIIGAIALCVLPVLLAPLLLSDMCITRVIGTVMPLSQMVITLSHGCVKSLLKRKKYKLELKGTGYSQESLLAKRVENLGVCMWVLVTIDTVTWTCDTLSNSHRSWNSWVFLWVYSQWSMSNLHLWTSLLHPHLLGVSSLNPLLLGETILLWEFHLTVMIM